MSISPARVAVSQEAQGRDLPGITAVGLTRRFHDRVAVDHIDLRVAPGEILALLGPNGAGKTTTVRMLAGILRPSEGTCRVAGHDVMQEANRVRAAVGLMTDDPGLYKEMTARAYLEWFGKLFGLGASDSRRRAEELVDAFGLGPWAAARVGTLSKGNQQKVALARALLHDPRVLLLDEPTAALDPEATVAMRELFRTLGQSGRSIVLCTHNLREAEMIANTVAILVAGKIAYYQRLSSHSSRRFQAVVRTVESVDTASLEALAGVEPESVRIGIDGRTITYATATADLTNPLVAALLVERACGLVGLHESSESLEDVYLKCLGGLAHEGDRFDRLTRAV